MRGVTFDITFHNGYQKALQKRQVAMRKKQLAEWLKIRKQMTDDPEQCMDFLYFSCQYIWKGIRSMKDIMSKLLRVKMLGQQM